MTADKGGFAEDDAIFYNHFRANFCKFYYIQLNFDNIESEFQKYINHKFS